MVFLDYNVLLEVAIGLGYRLAMSGAETFRVEESILRILDCYGIQGDAFAIPNYIHISIETPDGRPLSIMRRIGHHGNNLDAVEKYNSVCRRICKEKPDPSTAMQWVAETEQTCKQYRLPSQILGDILAALGFCILFGGSWKDSLCAGFCGLLVGVVNHFMDKMKVNHFFQIIIASFTMAFFAYLAGALRIIDNADMTIIGTLMILVPGLLFTNALRDIIYGDTNSGTNRIVQVFLIAAAIALGTGTALNISDRILTLPTGLIALDHSLIVELLAAFIGCVGFTIIFNIRTPGSFLCAAGGIVTWLIYRLAQNTGSDITAYLLATIGAAVYAEIMARIRKYPAISYLVVSLIPLIPGAGIYYTMNHVVSGNMTAFAEQGTFTVAIAGTIAVGILLVSTIFRYISAHIRHK